MSLPRAYLRQKLTEPLPIKGGTVLRTIGDAANYVLSLPHEQTERCQRWRRAAELLLDQADVADVSRQVHLALFYAARPQCDVPMIAIPKRQIDGSPS